VSLNLLQEWPQRINLKRFFLDSLQGQSAEINALIEIVVGTGVTIFLRPCPSLVITSTLTNWLSLATTRNTAL
jgi:hypothetical protein